MAEHIELGPLERSFGEAMKSAPPTRCLSAVEFLEFTEKGERAACYANVVAHLARCPACWTAVLEMRSAEASRPATSKAAWRWGRFGVAAAGLAACALAIALLSYSRHRDTNVVALNDGKDHPQVSGLHSVGNQEHTASPGSRPIGPISETAPINPPLISKTPTVKGPTITVKPTATKASSSLSPKQNGPALPNMSATAVLSTKTFCLVGTGHCYKLPSPDAKSAERQEIEENYADEVADAEEDYGQTAATSGSADSASAKLNEELKKADVDREERYATLFERQDNVLLQTPELQLDIAGPYQVIEVDYQAQQPVNFVVYPPWQGYHPDQAPYGWEYGQSYHRHDFQKQYVAWRNRFKADGPRSFCGLVGHHGNVDVSSIVGSRAAGYHMLASTGSVARSLYHAGGSFSRASSKSSGYHDIHHKGTGYTHPSASIPTMGTASRYRSSNSTSNHNSGGHGGSPKDQKSSHAGATSGHSPKGEGTHSQGHR